MREDEQIPADILLLHSTEENSICYIQTANLDGESNLKTKSAFVEDIKNYPEDFESLKGKLLIEQPNINLHNFDGFIEMKDCSQKPISLDNLLVRGSVLKNTDKVTGIVLYAGHDTKIMKNQG